MRILRPGFDLSVFFQSLARAPARVLALDYDGTLAPFHVRREEARPYPGMPEALDALMAAGHTRVVLITGRAVDDLIPLLGMRRLPEIWGNHGWQRRLPDGRVQSRALDAAAARGLAQAQDYARVHGFIERCESKPFSLALHWRGLSQVDIADLRGKALAGWNSIGARSGLALRDFDGGVELRSPGWDKGHTMRMLQSEHPTGAAVAFAGDDLTDEDAFQALGAAGLSVLVRSELRPTAADVWLRPPDELLDFLQNWTRSC